MLQMLQVMSCWDIFISISTQEKENTVTQHVLDFRYHQDKLYKLYK